MFYVWMSLNQVSFMNNYEILADSALHVTNIMIRNAVRLHFASVRHHGRRSNHFKQYGHQEE